MGRKKVSVPVTHIDADGVSSQRGGTVPAEEPLEIRIDGASWATLTRTPGNDVELAHGLMLARGAIRCAEQVEEACYCSDIHNYNTLDITLRPASGVAVQSPAPEKYLLEALPALSGAVVLTDQVIAREDLFLINAVDKCIGTALMGTVAPSALVIGEVVTQEIVERALAAGIPTVATTVMVTSAAVTLAKRSGIALVGNLREQGQDVFA